MITPTAGRVVWFTPYMAERFANHKPWAAIITFVHHDRMVNLSVFDPNGNQRPVTSVQLLQEGDDIPTGNAMYAQWIPYQLGQARAQEQAAAVVPQPVVLDTPESWNLIQPFNLARINPNVWVYCNLQLTETSANKISPRNRAAIRINCGCDDDGNLQPVGNRMFEQADSVAENARLDRINSSPRVGEITAAEPFHETGRPLGAALGLLGENKVPRIYALRATNWAAVQEWIDANAEVLARA